MLYLMKEQLGIRIPKCMTNTLSITIRCPKVFMPSNARKVHNLKRNLSMTSSSLNIDMEFQVGNWHEGHHKTFKHLRHQKVIEPRQHKGIPEKICNAQLTNRKTKWLIWLDSYRLLAWTSLTSRWLRMKLKKIQLKTGTKH